MTEAEQQTRALDIGHQLKMMTMALNFLEWSQVYINEHRILYFLADQLERYAAAFRESARALEQD